jgi:hypothetical protein
VGIVLPFSLICSPFAWSHDYIVCLPFFVLTAGLAVKRLHNSPTFSGTVLLVGLIVWQICDVTRVKLDMVGYLALFGSISLLPFLAALSIWLGIMKERMGDTHALKAKP